MAKGIKGSDGWTTVVPKPRHTTKTSGVSAGTGTAMQPKPRHVIKPDTVSIPSDVSSSEWCNSLLQQMFNRDDLRVEGSSASDCTARLIKAIEAKRKEYFATQKQFVDAERAEVPRFVYDRDNFRADHSSKLNRRELALLRLTYVLEDANAICVGLVNTNDGGYVVTNNRRDDVHFNNVMTVLRELATTDDVTKAKNSLEELAYNCVKVLKQGCADRVERAIYQSRNQAPETRGQNVLRYNILDQYLRNIDEFLKPECFESIKQLILESKISFARPVTENTSSDVHVEMALLSTVISDSMVQNPEYRAHIITSRLPCRCCAMAIEEINAIASPGSQCISTLGCHGNTFPAWKMFNRHSYLETVVHDRLQRLSGELSGKLSTSPTPPDKYNNPAWRIEEVPEVLRTEGKIYNSNPPQALVARYNNIQLRVQAKEVVSRGVNLAC